MATNGFFTSKELLRGRQEWLYFEANQNHWPMQRILLLPFAVLTTLSSQAQQIDFAPIGAKWNYYYIAGWGFGEGIYRLESVSDTVIDNRPCRKLCGAFDAPEEIFPDICAVENVHNIFIAQSNDSIFYYGGVNVYEFKYHFETTYELGDSTKFNLSPQSNLRWYEVVGFDTIWLNNLAVKCYTVHSESQLWGARTTHIYDRFGPYLSFVATWWGLDSDLYTFELRSYEDNNFPKVNLSADDCNVVLSSVSSLPFSDFLKISPNPVSDELTIFLPQTFDNDKLWVSINDMTGRTILRQNGFDNESKLDVSRLPTGFYQLVVQGSKTFHQQKFIKN